MNSIFFRLSLLLLLFAGFSLARLPGQSFDAAPDGGEILTRGPVHEAFAGVVSYRPEAGLIVNQAPPEPIEEIPPDERPVDADTAWIPGYWGWDDERNDFIWISGTWRVLPPGRAWISGYWGDTGRGWQWVSGYWEDANRREVVYLPPPPETLERGPSSPGPSSNYEWSPGSWEWRGDRYLWRPGYWIEGRADWVWVPSYYVWTPRGYVSVEGYWDYTPEERGLLFAPVYYREHRRAQYRYRPSIVLNVAVLADYLFLRPGYSHYYFGDYYDSRYESSGIFASFSYQSSRRGYDPLYSYNRWQHREERGWDQSYRDSYDYRRRNQDARPPRTWSGSTLTVNVNLYQKTTQFGGRSRQSVTYAQPIEQYARTNEARLRVERSAPNNFQQQSQLARQVQEQRQQRRTSESQQGGYSSPQAGAGSRQYSQQRQIGGSGREQAVINQDAVRVTLPTSPIVARESSGGRQPPPRAHSSRREDAGPSRQPDRPGSPDSSSSPSNQLQPPGRSGRDSRGPGESTQAGGIGTTPNPAPGSETFRDRQRGSRVDNSAAAEARRIEAQGRLSEQRQAEDAAARTVSQSPTPIIAQPLPVPADQVQAGPVQPAQPGAGRDFQSRERADAQRRATDAQENPGQQPPQPGPAREEQSRREQEREGRQRAQVQQEQLQQQQAQQQAAQEQAARQERDRVRQSRAAEQVQAHEQQDRAAEEARQREGQAAEQARGQQAQAEQARAQQAQAEQNNTQQAQPAEQAREQVRDQQAAPPPQPEPARQNATPSRGQGQRPPRKAPPPKAQGDEEQRKAQADEEERRKGKGGSE